MCGFAGFWNVGSGAPASSAIITAMVRTLAHRGPDTDGYLVDGSLALGMQRLRVIDPEGGQQPMPNEDASVHVVFNGEIYNHRELQADLERRGHRFRSRSDTEAIVHAYEEWGVECVTRFNGMFGFAVWDARRQRLLLARDRLGIKPLYVWQGAEGVVFGSELKAIVTAPWVDVAWNLEAVDDFMTYEYVPTPHSIVRGVRKMAAGSTLVIERGRPGAASERRFWRMTSGAPAPASRAAAAEELRERLRTSVRRRLLADVPVGAFLSGGIDSSIIVALMSGETPGHVRSFSLGFADRSYDELPFARMVAERYGTTHREERVTPEIVALAERLADHFDEPFGDVSAFPTFLISRLARRDVTVALSGDGGDELFAGYDHYRAHRMATRIQWLTRRWPWRLVERALERIPPAEAKKGLVNKAKRFAEGVSRPADLEHARWWLFSDAEMRRVLYAGDLAATARMRDPFGYYRERLAEGAAAGFDGLQRRLYADITGYLADDILVKVDRMSMAVSLEARVPFLDHEVVEHAMRIPAEWKLDGGTGKAILKEAFRAELPPAIRQRGKEGFSIPMKNWLRGPLAPMMRELLGERRVQARGLFDHRAVNRLMQDHLANRANNAHQLWCLMSLELSLDALGARTAGRTSLLRQAAS